MNFVVRHRERSLWAISASCLALLGACATGAEGGDVDEHSTWDAASQVPPEGNGDASVPGAKSDAGHETTWDAGSDTPWDAGNDTPPQGGEDPADPGPGDGQGVALKNPAPGSKKFVGANFWNIDWEGSDNYFKSGVNFANTTDPWRPELLADLEPYHVLRFMDWNLTNDSNSPQANWDTRKQPTQQQNSPVAYEWQIDLCNRTKKDYWVAVPWRADDAYMKNLAELIHERLDPDLRVYVEWANEVWNAGFAVSRYAAQEGQRLGLPGSDPAASYQVHQSVRLFAAFDEVFGKDNPRVVKVLAGMAAWTGPCEAQLTAFEKSTINPQGIRPDVYAIAPYLQGLSMQELRNNLPQVRSWVSNTVTCAQRAQLPVISYEGGTDSFAGDCEGIQRDAGMRALYREYLDTVFDAGMTGPFVQYTHSGACWGLKVRTGDANEASPRYAGVLDWLAENP